MVLQGHFLLYTLNEYLAHTALLVQPLWLPADRNDAEPLFAAVDVPLPLQDSSTVTGKHPQPLNQPGSACPQLSCHWGHTAAAGGRRCRWGSNVRQLPSWYDCSVLSLPDSVHILAPVPEQQRVTA